MSNHQVNLLINDFLKESKKEHERSASVNLPSDKPFPPSYNNNARVSAPVQTPQVMNNAEWPNNSKKLTVNVDTCTYFNLNEI